MSWIFSRRSQRMVSRPTTLRSLKGYPSRELNLKVERLEERDVPATAISAIAKQSIVDGFAQLGTWGSLLETGATFVAGFGNLGKLTITAGSKNLFSKEAPQVSVSYNLSADMRTQILSALDKVGGVVTTLNDSTAVNTKLPIIGVSLNDAIGGVTGLKVGDLLSIKGAVETYFTTNVDNSTVSGTIDAMVAAVTAKLDPKTTGSFNYGPVSVVGGLDFATKTLAVTLGVDAKVERQYTVALGQDAGQALGELGVTLNASAKIGLGVELKTALTTGIDLSDFLANPANGIASKNVFVQIDPVVASGTLALSDFKIDIKAGFIQASVIGGAGTFQPTATVTINGGNKITLADIGSGSLSSKITFASSGALDVQLPLRIDFGGFQTDAVNPPTVLFAAADVFAGGVPTVSLANFDSLADVSNYSPQQMLGLFVQFGEWLGQFRNTEIFKVQVPFTSSTKTT